MSLTFRPFAETPQVEELVHELENPKPKPDLPHQTSVPGITLAGWGLMMLALVQKGFLKWMLFLGGLVCLALGSRR